MRYNTQDLINTLSGKNKAFITRIAKRQEQKYGNIDIFSACVLKSNASRLEIITMSFEDYWIDFYFLDGKIKETYDNGQGHKYCKNLEECAKELYKSEGLSYGQAYQVARKDYYCGICFAIDMLEELGYDCSSYHEEMKHSTEENFDSDNIIARNNLYARLGIVEIMQRAYEDIERGK